MNTWVFKEILLFFFNCLPLIVSILGYLKGIIYEYVCENIDTMIWEKSKIGLNKQSEREKKICKWLRWLSANAKGFFCKNINVFLSAETI